MTFDQATTFAVIAGMMALFIWGRLRYDLVAVLALLAAVFMGVVPHKEAFSGFGDDIVIIVASALVVSAAVARSGVIEAALQRIGPSITSIRLQVVVLVATVTLLSAFVKNIGALAMMIPVAFQMARRSNASPSLFLMPMAFGSLLGGLITLVGTSPNIIVSRVRQEMTGQPFSMFDFTPVGLGLAAAGVAFLAFGYRLLPSGRRAAATMDDACQSSGRSRLDQEVCIDGPEISSTRKDVFVVARQKNDLAGFDWSGRVTLDIQQQLSGGDVVITDHLSRPRHKGNAILRSDA